MLHDCPGLKEKKKKEKNLSKKQNGHIGCEVVYCGFFFVQIVSQNLKTDVDTTNAIKQLDIT